MLSVWEFMWGLAGVSRNSYRAMSGSYVLVGIIHSISNEM